MIKTLIAKDVAYGAKVGGGTVANVSEITQLEDGAIALFTAGNVFIPAAATAASLAGVQQFYIVVGTPNDSFMKKSYLIDRDAHIQEYCQYAAPAVQQTIVGEDGAGTGDMNLPATLVPGTEASLVVIDRTKGWHEANQVKRYHYFVKAGDTAEEVIQGLADNVNGDTTSIVTATVLTNGGTKVGLRLDGVEVTTIFTAKGDDIAEQATIDTTQLNDIGKGTVDILTALENEGLIFEGDTNFIELEKEFFDIRSFIAAGGTYDSWNFGWTHETRSAKMTKITQDLETLLAVPTGATALITALQTLFGVVFTGQTTGSGTSTIPA